jgi:DNA polymerase III alpha subunit
MTDAPKILPFPAPAERDAKAPREKIRYVEFAVSSNFSFLRGASHPEELMLQATSADIELTGLGLSDRNSVAGVVRAHLIKRE